MKTNLMMGIGNGGCNVVRKFAEHDLEEMSFFYYLGEDDCIIEDILKDTKYLIIVACLGGMSGSTFVLKVATAAQKLGVPTFVVVTTPFAFEGSVRMKRALATIEKLQQVEDIKIFNNEELNDKCADLTMENAFEKSDNELINIICDCYNKEIISPLFKSLRDSSPSLS